MNGSVPTESTGPGPEAAVSAPTSGGPLDTRLLTWLTLGLIAVGVVCRLVRYLAAPPLWCDEVFIAFNFPDRDYLSMASRLEYSQIAPILFLWMEKSAYSLLGSSEWALRLLPFLAGVAALPLFWHLARKTLPPLAATLATGTLAVSRWPMAMSNLVKPYSFDLLFSVALLLLAVHWIERPTRLRFLVLLILILPPALLASFPVVFVAGGVAIALAPWVWRGGWPARWLYLAYNLTLVGVFVGNYLIVGKGQLGPSDHNNAQYYYECWSCGFMPRDIARVPGWLLQTFTGDLLAYPFGDRNWASTPSFVLFLLGIIWCWRHERRWLPLLVAPFALALLASALEKYPFGTESRLDQYLVPSICWLLGAGLAGLITKARGELSRRRWTLAACAALAGCGVAVSFLGTSRPASYEREALWARKIANELRKQTSDADQIVILQSKRAFLPVLRWQLSCLGPRVVWNGRADWDRLRANDGSLWLLSLRVGPSSPGAHGLTLSPGEGCALWRDPGIDAEPRPLEHALAGCLAQGAHEWFPIDHVTYAYQDVKDANARPYRCDLFPCARKGKQPTQQRFFLSCWPP